MLKRLVIIDGKSVFYRGYYAMGALATSDGTPTGGVYGFAAIAMELVKKLAPTKVVVAWDKASTSISKRREIFADYKAGRTKPPEDFYAQIPLLKELILALGWSFVECDNYEADDIIGSLALQADKDVDENGVCRWDTFIISSDLDMLQIVDENTRMYRLMKGFTQLEELDVPAVEAKYGIRKWQFLDLKALKGDASDNIPGVPGIGEKGAVKLLSEYGDLDGIYGHIDEIKGAVHDKLVAGKESAYMSYKLAKIMTDAPVVLAELPELRMDKDKIRAALEKLEFRSLIRKFLVDMPAEARTQDEEVGGELPDFPEPEIIGWDVKSMMHIDAQLREKVLAGEKFWDLGQGRFLLGWPKEEQQNQQLSLLELSDDEKREEYKLQMTEFAKLPKLYKVMTELDMPLVPVLYKMEVRGMKIDAEYFKKLVKEFEGELHELEEKIYSLAGKTFNLNSPIQLSEVLFVDLRLPTFGIKKTTRGYSTSAAELEKLSDKHPIVSLVVRHRTLAKLVSTYAAPLPSLADANGRVHTTFTQNVTATGRLSSVSPNLQNIPTRTEEGKKIRTGFVADEGKVLVSADYSQFELRLAAALSGDKALIEDFNAGVDIHKKTAAEAFGVPFDEVTKEQRRAAKVINFGVLYGMSAKGLAAAAEMSFVEAQEFIRRYFELRAPIKKKLEEILSQAKTQGYVETFYGRRRLTPGVRERGPERAAAERAAQNMPIQGTEADLMKKAMIAVDAALPEGAELIMQVHDSLIVECEPGLVDEVKEILKREMEGVAPELPVKLAVDVTSGQNWGEL